MDCGVINKDQLPLEFHCLENPPERLFYEGSLEILKKPRLAIVGARKIVPWVEQWMEQELFPILKDLDVAIVSGGARGVDQRAHFLALRAGLPTIAILPSGLKNKYPTSIQQMESYREKVLFLSEYEDHEAMKKHYFYSRNRLIAASSNILFVVQAAEKSGSMITARLALEMGRSIATIPANPMEVQFSGNLQLLFEGAIMIRGKKDLESLL